MISGVIMSSGRCTILTTRSTRHNLATKTSTQEQGEKKHRDGVFSLQNTKKDTVTEFLIFLQDWLQQHRAVQRHKTRHARLRASRGAEGPLDDCKTLKRAWFCNFCNISIKSLNYRWPLQTSLTTSLAGELTWWATLWRSPRPTSTPSSSSSPWSGPASSSSCGPGLARTQGGLLKIFSLYVYWALWVLWNNVCWPKLQPHEPISLQIHPLGTGVWGMPQKIIENLSFIQTPLHAHSWKILWKCLEIQKC